MTRKDEVTVRLPTARMAPTSRSLACSKTRWEKQGAKLTIKGTSSTGRVSIKDLSWRKSPQLTPPVVSFSKSKMDKVELRSSRLTGERGLLARPLSLSREKDGQGASSSL